MNVYASLLPAKNLSCQYRESGGLYGSHSRLKQSRHQGVNAHPSCSTRNDAITHSFSDTKEQSVTESGEDAEPNPTEEEIRILRAGKVVNNASGQTRSDEFWATGSCDTIEHECDTLKTKLDDDSFNLIYPMDDWSGFDFSRAMQLGQTRKLAEIPPRDEDLTGPNLEMKRAWRARLRAIYLYRALGSEDAPWRTEKAKRSSTLRDQKIEHDEDLSPNFPEISARQYNLEAREWLQRQLVERQLVAIQEIKCSVHRYLFDDWTWVYLYFDPEELNWLLFIHAQSMLDATHDRRQKQATILQAVIHPHILSPAAITSVVVTDESMLFLTYDRDVSNYQAQAGTRLPFYCPPWLQKELSTKTRHKYNSHWNSGNGIGIWIEYGDFDKEKKSERLRLEMERYSPPFSAAFAYGCAIEWAFAHLSKQRGIFHPANKKLHSHKNKIRSVIAGVTYLTSQKFLDVPFTALTSLRKLSIEHRSNNLVCHCANSDDPRLIVLRLTVFKFGRDGQHSEKGPKPVENMLLTDVKDQVYSGWFVVNRSRTHETLAVPASKTEDSLTTKIDDNSNPLCFESPLSGLEKFMEFSKGMRVPARDYWTVLRDIFWNHTVLSICSVSDNSIALLAKREPISSSFYRCNTDGSNEEICGEDFPFLLMPNAELIYMVISLNSLISSSPLVERSFSLCLNSENLKSSATYVSPFHLEFVSTSHSWSGSTWRPQQEHKFAYYPQQTCIRGITSSNSDDHDIFDLNAELYEISEFAEHSDQFETYTVQEDLSPLFMDRKKDNLGPARVLIPRSSRKRMWERLYGLGSNDKPEIFIVTKTEVMRVPLHDLKVMESPLKGSNMTKYERDGLADLVNLDIASELRDIAFQWLCRITDESSEFFGTLLCRHFRVRFSRVNSEVPIIDTIKDCMQRAIKDRHCYPASSSDSSLISTKSARIERVMKRPFSEDILVLTSDPLCACCFFIDQKRWSCRFISSKRSTHFVSASWDSTGKTLTIILSDGSIRVLNEYLAIMKASTTCDALAGIFKQQEVQHTFTKRLCKHHFETVILSVVLAGKAGQRGGLLTVKAECTRNFTRKVYNILQCSSVNHLVSEGERVCENFMSLLNGTASQGFRPLPFMWSAMDCIENSLDALMQLMQSGDSKQFSTMYANNLAYFWYSVLCRLADLSDENNAILRFPVLLNAIGWWGLYLGYRMGIHKLVLRHYGHSGLETLGSLHRDIAITQEMTKYYLAGYSAVHLPEHMEDDFANLDKHLAAANIDHNKRRGSQNLLAGLARDIERRALELAK